MSATRLFTFVHAVICLLVLFFFSQQLKAQQCECVVDVGNQNRRIWGSWALECNNHAGHGDCPTTNIDTAHSPGASAMTGDLYVYARYNGAAKASWKKSLPDDHITAFKGPVYTSHDGWEWTNSCSCDGFRGTSCSGSPHSQWWDYNAPMYAGAQEDTQYVFQGRSKALRFPAACGDQAQQITVHEAIRENDPFSADDPMGTIETGVPVRDGTYNYTQWAEHFEPAYYSNGSRSHAGYSGGYYGAELVVSARCYNVAIANDTAAPSVAVTSHANGDTVSTSSITLTGTATDYGYGGNGISSVAVNGVRAAGDTVAGSATANWAVNLNLSAGNNTITILARDNSTYKNLRTISLSVVYSPPRGPASDPTPPPAPTSSDTLATGQRLTRDQSLTSGNGAYTLLYQGDGNLVVYQNGVGPLWASNTFGEPGQAVIQGDGNFVIYNSSGAAVWASNTFAGNAYLVMQNDGNLVVYSAGIPLWSWMTGRL